MAIRKIYHVLPYDADWAVKIGNAKRASAVLRTKIEAVQAAANFAKSSPKAQVVIHEANGKIKSDRIFEYLHYKKKKKVRLKVGKIKKAKIKTKRRRLRMRSLRRKAAMLGIARSKRLQYRRRVAARKAAKTRRRK
jgi:hypothetical protein